MVALRRYHKGRLMQKFLQKLKKGYSRISEKQDQILEEEIPRYPPFSKGLPAASSAQLIAMQTSLMTKIKATLPFNETEFNLIAMPIIERYAAYVHLLPASEAHHHRGAGGLFRHGLEAGFWAAQAADSFVFCPDGTPEHRRTQEPRWQVAAFLGGMLHDVGKPITDLVVVNSDGTKEWDSCRFTLTEWARKEGIDRYYVRWKPRRGKNHEKASSVRLDLFIHDEAWEYLNVKDREVTLALLEAISGTSASEALTKIVLWADQESVRRDIVNQRLDIDEHSYGVPVERFVFDALRRFVKESKVNEPGALVWRVHDSVYLSWKGIVENINQILKNDGISGIPKDPETLADILLEKDFASYFEYEDHSARYWNIYPHLLNGVCLTCLKIDQIELIYPGEPPVGVEASFSKTDYDEFVSKGKEKENRAPVQPYSTPIDKNIKKPEQTAAIEDNQPLPISDKPEIIYKISSELEKESDFLTLLPEGRSGIHHPKETSLLGDPKEIMETLYKLGYLDIDKLSNSKTRKISGERYLVLTQECFDLINSQSVQKNEPLEKQEEIETPQNKQKEIEAIDNNRESDIEKKSANKSHLGKLNFEHTFNKQVASGFGPYISGEVKTGKDKKRTIYTLDIDSVDQIAEYHNTSANEVKRHLKKMAYVTLTEDSIVLVTNND